MELKDFKIDMQSSIFLWLQLANQLEQAIEQRRWKVNSTLPSIIEMSRNTSVSKATVFRAYCQLVKKGLLQWVKHEGFFVKR